MYPFLQNLHIDYNIDIFVRRVSWRFATSCHRTMFCWSRERLNKGINNACLDLTKFGLDPLMKTNNACLDLTKFSLDPLMKTNNACLDLTKFSLDPLMKTKKMTRVFHMWILHMLISTTTSLREILNSCFLISFLF